MNNRHNTETGDRKRLEKLIAGQTRGGYITDSETNHTLKNPMKLRLLILVGIWIIFLVYYAYLNFSNPPSHTYNFNPVSKIILKIKSTDFMEENYADFEENMEIDINTDMVKNKNGYTVTCEDKDNSSSKVIIYFNRKFEILNHRPNIIPDN